MSEQQGIQSLDAALRILKAMAGTHRSMSLKEIAAAVDMTASNTHRYMVSFMRSDLVCQESDTGRYDLGPFALQIGLAAMVRMDPIAVATKIATELRAEIDMPVTLTVWTPDGPTMIRWLDASQPLTVNVKAGSRSPILTSASGRVFLAYESEERTRALVTAELRARRSRKEDKLTTAEEVNALRSEVKARGLGRVIGERVSGINGLSAPIFDAMGQLALTISSVGLEYSFDASYDSPVAHAILAAAERASILLGYRPHLKNPANQESANHVQ